MDRWEMGFSQLFERRPPSTALSRSSSKKSADRVAAGGKSLTIIVFLVVSLCALSPGCRNRNVELGFHFLEGKMVANKGVSVFPDWRWHPYVEFGGSFQKSAKLLLWVESAAEDDLVFSFSPDNANENSQFMVSWDGDPLWDAPRSGGRQALKVEISRASLAPGAHHLTITSTAFNKGGGNPDVDDCEFSRVEISEKRSARVLGLGIHPNIFIAAFLEYGVTGLSTTRRDGMLFVGPQRLEASIDARQESEASFLLQNNSQREAVFRILIDRRKPLEYRLPAEAELPIDFDFPPGIHQTVFEVEGGQNGTFYWGAPYLRAKDSGPPNRPIIFLTLDTTRWDAVAPFNRNPELTPNLAAFANHATAYWNAWATAPWTLPSHASMFTGLYPSHHGAGVTKDALGLTQVTLAELLRERGYRTGGFIGGPLAGALFGLSQGFSEYHDPEGWETKADGVTDAALSFITDNSRSPLFVFINYFDPHEPYEAPEAFRTLTVLNEMADAVTEHPGDSPMSVRDSGLSSSVAKNTKKVDGSGVVERRKAYLAEIAFMDSQIGRLFDGLRRLGLYDAAMIVAVSDHGEFLGERGLFGHSYRLDPELTRVPLLIKWPHQNEAVEVNELVSHVDLFATVGAAAGVAVPASDGYPLPLASSAVPGGRELAIIEEHASRVHPLVGPNKLADHLFGLQWLDRREVIIGPRIECQIKEAETWMQVPCDSGLEDPSTLLSDRMRAVARIKALHTMGDLEKDELEKLRALGYLD